MDVNAFSIFQGINRDDDRDGQNDAEEDDQEIQNGKRFFSGSAALVVIVHCFLLCEAPCAGSRGLFAALVPVLYRVSCCSLGILLFFVLDQPSFY